MTCDHGTGFDVKLNMCVWSYLVEGCINNDESGSAIVESEERGIKPETKMSEARDKWSSLEVDFVCPEENGVFPDLYDCSTYYTCIDNVAKRMKCSFGTGYDDGTSLCMDARQVPRCKESSIAKESNIKSSVIPKVPFTCPKNHGLYPDTGNCSRFIHCFNKTAYRHECMPGTAFSSEKGLCTWRHQVPECNKESESFLKTTPSLTLPSSEIKTLKNAVAQGSPWKYEPSVPYQTSLSEDEDEEASDQTGIQDFQCPSVLDGFYRDNLFCDIFHRCVLGTRFTFTCPTGTFFRIEGNLCDFWETVSDCTQDGIRLEALNSLPEVAPVPTPLPVQRPVPNEVEVDIVSIDADPTPCPASSGLFAHPRNCKQFLFCAHHVPLVLTCPESLLYNSQTLTCDFPKNVKCLRYDHYKK
ncbi:unnamed protein product [Lymnaea stagnalis]|uniref:Chitin-binding type-2 domain-containing protein n=1 Tax=Lymnaea stagnalis TaxID=6523 RepID=A0AAV2I016_LYMST